MIQLTFAPLTLAPVIFDWKPLDPQPLASSLHAKSLAEAGPFRM
jgi:hypothetical protein